MTDLFTSLPCHLYPHLIYKCVFGEIVQGMYLVKCYVLNGE